MVKFKLVVYVVSISFFNYIVRYMYFLLDRIYDFSFGLKCYLDLRDIFKNGLIFKLSIN